MNIEYISSVQTPSDYRPAVDGSAQAVIDLEQIKSILYLGVKGKISLPASEYHRVDTFA